MGNAINPNVQGVTYVPPNKNCRPRQFIHQWSLIWFNKRWYISRRFSGNLLHRTSNSAFHWAVVAICGYIRYVPSRYCLGGRRFLVLLLKGWDSSSDDKLSSPEDLSSSGATATSFSWGTFKEVSCPAPESPFPAGTSSSTSLVIGGTKPSWREIRLSSDSLELSSNSGWLRVLTRGTSSDTDAESFNRESSTAMAPSSSWVPSRCKGSASGNSIFLCNVRSAPEPSQCCTTYTGIPESGFLMILYGSDSHLSASLCFPVRPTSFTRTRSPTSGTDPRTRRS